MTKIQKKINDKRTKNNKSKARNGQFWYIKIIKKKGNNFRL